MTPAGIEGHAGIAGRRDDAAPVRDRPRAWPSSPAGCWPRSWRSPGPSSRSAQPLISMVTRCVAPSPSPAIALARSTHTSSRARLEGGQVVAGQRLAAGRAVGQQQHRVVGAHVAVDAHAVEAVVGRGAQGRLGRRPASSGASVMISASMVAMFGPIIAAPLAMPVIWISRPPMVTRAAGQLVDRVGGQHAAGGGDQRRLRCGPV